MKPSHRPRRVSFAVLAALMLTLAACGTDDPGTGAATGRPAAAPDPGRVLKISAIPDQDPAKLTAVNRAMAEYLAGHLGRRVDYVPVTDYAAAVSLFRTGDLDVVFFGGLTGVQARLQAPGAILLAQRDIDDAFQSVFIANARAGVGPLSGVEGLVALKGRRFTFGSESSTSGRLMPEYFLDRAGVSSSRDFSGPPGFSGSHDKTVELVESGTYEVGVLNWQVWEKRKKEGTVDLSKVTELLVTPPYHDYHWMAGPRTEARFGKGFADKVTEALLALDRSDPSEAALLDLYGADRFIPTVAANYAEIEQIGRKLNLVT